MKRALALAVLLVCGCAGVRPAAPPAAAVQAPAAWRTTLGPGTPVDAGWWNGFGDPELTRLVEAALANNVDIAVAAARVEEARAQFRLAEAQRLPNVQAAAGGGEEREVSPFGTGVTTQGGQGLVAASYDLDLFGRLRTAAAAARAAMLASAAARDGVRLAVASATASGYIGLRSLDARLVVLKETLASRTEELRIARRRADTGYTSRLELSQAEAEYRGTEQLIPAAELAISRQEDALSLLVGESPRAIARGAALDAMRAPPVPAGLPSDLLRRRPDIAQAEDQLVAADRSLDSARAAFLPDVQLTASGGLAAAGIFPENPITLFSVGGSILAPIFDSGRLKAQADVAAARRDQAAFAYRRTALTAFREVDDALAAVVRAEQQERSVTAQRDALAEALRFAADRYRAGYSPYLEQLLAQRGLLAADLTLVQLHADRLTAMISLYQALGGGWVAAAPPQKS